MNGNVMLGTRHKMEYGEHQGLWYNWSSYHNAVPHNYALITR